MQQGTLVEVCVDTLSSAGRALEGGAHRLELCSGLAEGGLTPSIGLIRLVASLLEGSGCGLHVLIRPRPGDFCYNRHDLLVMRQDVQHAKHAGAQGVVLGMLRADGSVDKEALTPFCSLCRDLGLSVTFHRAFDLAANRRQGLQDLIECGVQRVLTSGGASSADKGLKQLRSLVRQAKGRIGIIAGGGVTPGNVQRLLRETGVREVHASCRSLVPSPAAQRDAPVRLCSPEALLERDTLCCNQETVQALLRQCRRVVPEPDIDWGHVWSGLSLPFARPSEEEEVEGLQVLEGYE